MFSYFDALRVINSVTVYYKYAFSLLFHVNISICFAIFIHFFYVNVYSCAVELSASEACACRGG